MRTDAKTADSGQALGEGADDEIDFVKQPALLGQAQPALAEDAEGMGLVDQQPGAVTVLDFDEVSQRGLVAEHGIQPFNNHQRAPCAVTEATEAPIEVFRIVVAKPDRLGVGQPTAIIDAGMAVGVDQQVIIASGQSRQGAEVGLVAGRKDDRARPSEGRGEILLQRPVPGVAAVGHARTGRSGAQLLQRVAPGGDDFGVKGQPEVVVGSGQDDFAPVDQATRGRQHVLDGGRDRRRRDVAQGGARFEQRLEFVE